MKQPGSRLPPIDDGRRRVNSLGGGQPKPIQNKKKMAEPSVSLFQMTTATQQPPAESSISSAH